MDAVKRRLSAAGAQRSNSVHATNADADLAKMGYKSELPRSLSMLSVLGMSFAIMAVPFGLSTTLYITLVDGQSVTIIWGWVFVSLISLSIAASLAEICMTTGWFGRRA
jgi:amino acid transporter